MLCSGSLSFNGAAQPRPQSDSSGLASRKYARAKSMRAFFASPARCVQDRVCSAPFKHTSKTFAFSAAGALFSCSRFHTAFGTVRQISSIPDDPQSRTPARALCPGPFCSCPLARFRNRTPTVTVRSKRHNDIT